MNVKVKVGVSTGPDLTHKSDRVFLVGDGRATFRQSNVARAPCCWPFAKHG